MTKPKLGITAVLDQLTFFAPFVAVFYYGVARDNWLAVIGVSAAIYTWNSCVLNTYRALKNGEPK